MRVGDVRGVQVKKAGMAPSPRTSFALATHRKRAVLFGGVFDREGLGDKLYSQVSRVEGVCQCVFACPCPNVCTSLPMFMGQKREKREKSKWKDGFDEAGLSKAILPAGTIACHPSVLRALLAPLQLYNDMYQFNFDLRRWFPVALRPTNQQKGGKVGPQASSAQQQQQQEGEGGGESGGSAAGEPKPLPPGVSPEMHEKLMQLAADKGSVFHRAAEKIQAHFRGHMVRKAFQAYKLGGQISELLYSPATYGVDLSAADMLKPRARSAPMVSEQVRPVWARAGLESTCTASAVLTCAWHAHPRRFRSRQILANGALYPPLAGCRAGQHAVDAGRHGRDRAHRRCAGRPLGVGPG